MCSSDLQPDTKRIAVMVDLAPLEQISAYSRVMGAARVDDLVRKASQKLAQRLGSKRTIYHTGPTQFAFLASPDVQQNAYVSKLIAEHWEERQRSSGASLMTSALGVAVFAPGSTEPQDLLRALASAAQDARSSLDLVSVYSPAADEAYQRRYRLLDDFGSALQASNQLRLVFQPRIELGTGRCLGVEALLRWDHPELGNVSPGEFIPIVEHSPHAQAMTAFVLDTAMAQLRGWHDAGHDLVVSVNVSAANLHEPDFAEAVGAAILRHGVKTHQIELEVTESAVMQDADQARAQLDRLSAMGIRLAIDDFGTGYSSLAYLQKLPANVVKIDQSFVREMTSGEKDQSLVRSMISLLHDLGYRVVAEGVELIEAAELLRSMNCDEAQGYLFARPMEKDKLDAWLHDQNDQLLQNTSLAA